MRTVMRSIMPWIVVAAAMIVARAGGQDTLTLRPSVTLTPGAAVTIGDIADVAGTQADVLRPLVVLDAAGVAKQTMGADKHVRVDLALVRRLLSMRKDVNMGRLVLAGTVADVTIGDTAPAVTPPVEVPAAAGPTVADELPAAVARALALPLESVRLDTASVPQEVLATGLAGRTHVISPTAKGDVLPVQVRVYDGDRVILTQNIRVGVQVKQRGAVAARDIKRGDVLTEADVREDEVWVPASVVAADVALVPGSTSRAAIKAGSVIEDRQVVRPPAVRRGDLVSVDCISGTILLRATMRARGDGRVGEVIWVEPVVKTRAARKATDKGDKTASSAQTSPVRARISGPGRAVTVASDQVGEEPQGTPIAKSGFAPEDPADHTSAQPTRIVDVRTLPTGF